jgi:hypothetical protein
MLIFFMHLLTKRRVVVDKKWIFVLLGLSLSLMVMLSGCVSQQPAPTPTPTPTVTAQPTASPKMFSQAEADSIMQWRVLWTDHAVWTRMYIIESLDNSYGASAAATRLLKNQEDIGNALKPYYGDAAGTQLTALLKTHIYTAVNIIDDVKAKKCLTTGYRRSLVDKECGYAHILAMPDALSDGVLKQLPAKF